LKNGIWFISEANSTDTLHYAVFDLVDGGLVGGGAKLQFLYIVSDVLGLVTIGGVEFPVTPKTLETFISITGWQFIDPANHLVIVAGVASGAFNAVSTGRATISSGVGDSQVYVYFAKEAMVDGSMGTVTVTRKTSVALAVVFDDDTTTTVDYQTAVTGTQHYEVVELSFPAGGGTIRYDPAVGVGAPLPNDLDSGSSLIVSFLLTLAVLLMF